MKLFVPEIYDFEVWVTPTYRYLVIPQEGAPMCIEYPDEDYIVEPDPNRYLHTPTWLFEYKNKGSLIVQRLEDQQHTVRLKEVSKPRFGEPFWMMTNRIIKPNS